jgi:hypothetical protein
MSWLSSQGLHTTPESDSEGSKREMQIALILSQNDVEFVREVSFYENNYRYDFAILTRDQDIILLEYHGKQHYEWDKTYHSTYEEFKHYQEVDKIKNELALSKGCNPMVINSDNFQYIEEILGEYL